MERATGERILIVEDDPATLGWLLAELGALAGVQASGCAGVAEARRWLEQNQPHIVLTDLGLPDGSGIEVIGLALRLHPQCEVLVISIFGDDTHVVAAIEAGASGYLLKDSSLEHLGEQLQHLRDGGSPLSPQIARTLIRRQRPPPLPAGAGAAAALTDRELDVLTFIAKGFSYQEGAAMLGVSTNTVRTHVKRIYQKLAVNSRSEAVYEYNLWQSAHGLPPLR
ncbi:MAG: response regulator transcription factor [Burkholderiaceae bacterium]|nr:response regulator transcription factor [Burkholderiaceae bacterium]